MSCAGIENVDKISSPFADNDQPLLVARGLLMDPFARCEIKEQKIPRGVYHPGKGMIVLDKPISFHNLQTFIGSQILRKTCAYFRGALI